MKKMFKVLLIICILAVVCTAKADARSIKIPDGCEVMRCTCYLPTGNKTADGTIPYEGICASNMEHLGMVAVVYTLDMVGIGYFECRDTGSHEELKNGTRIDIYRETNQGVADWIAEYGDYVIVQWVEGNG